MIITNPDPDEQKVKDPVTCSYVRGRKRATIRISLDR
jgi:hypothetical protein